MQDEQEKLKISSEKSVAEKMEELGILKTMALHQRQKLVALENSQEEINSLRGQLQVN